ncbi:bifunctional aspartate kinase/homoserine dehydrogenase II [Rheinheimera sp.]|uniref:bifunctional aspartate kinase/homoserine dehydrogenase II n=1 Tax=Rheinheimera sp. TaxID=1869214 RepID=UPI00307F53E1
MSLVVHKFGGSSLASAERFAAVADILQKEPEAWVVVSAPGDTTDELLALIDSREQPDVFLQLQTGLQHKLQLLARRTLAEPEEIMAQVSRWVAEIPGFLAAQQLNDVLAIGERFSSQLLAALLNERGLRSQALDARDFLRLDGSAVDWHLSAQLLEPLKQSGLNVVTGYIARTIHGQSITLGRNGSDYSATILGRLLHASAIHIWTDVDAIYSADPRKVPSARAYKQVPWQQALTLAALGNPVLHAKTLSPLLDAPADLVVRSSFNPEHPGCKVSQQSAIEVQFLTDIQQAALVSLPAHCALNAADLAAQLQQPVIAAPGKAQQWLVPAAVVDPLLSILASQNVFARVSPQLYHLVAWVKPAARRQKQVSTQAQQWLQRQAPAAVFNDEQLAVWLFAQPLTSLELTELHQALLPSVVRLNLVVAGTGNVGSEFLQLLERQQQALAGQIELNLAGLLNSRQALFAESLSLSDWAAQLQQAPLYTEHSLQLALQELAEPKVLIDLTPSQAFAERYPQFIQTGFDLISANKQGVTLPLAQFQHIKQLAAQQQVQWLSNTTVGAGLPVQRLLQELRSSGDTVHAVSGIFSGTLSWLLAKFDGSVPFSALLKQAQQLGFTEPDPRDDLSGKDVQRKLLVLARELDLPLELEQIALEPLLPAVLADGSVEQFWQQAEVLDHAFAPVLAEAQQQGKVLRYIAELKIEQGKAKAQVRLVSVAPDHPLAAIIPCDNVFVIESDWYQQNPLVLKGPGAGRQVTAGGVHADLALLAKQKIAAAKAAQHSQAQAAAWVK